MWSRYVNSISADIGESSSVNEDQSLHQDADPRYRGSYIPSRAFRMLQNFTADTDDTGNILIVIAVINHAQLIHRSRAYVSFLKCPAAINNW